MTSVHSVVNISTANVVNSRPSRIRSALGLLFSVVALIALGAISGQYGKRQARLERQYQARERIQNDQLGTQRPETPRGAITRHPRKR